MSAAAPVSGCQSQPVSRRLAWPLVLLGAWLAATLAIAEPEPKAEPQAMPVGLRQWQAQDSARPGFGGQGRWPLALTLWYPAQAGSRQKAIAAGPFEPEPLAPDAPLADTARQLPLLLLSHGTGGSAMSLGWLARALAAEGYLVLGVDHAGNSAAVPPLRVEAFVTPWQRPRDLSAALDLLLADPQWGARIDRGRIGAVGFSLGGYTVLATLGARFSASALAQFWSECLNGRPCALPPELERIRQGRSVSALLSDTPGLIDRLRSGREGAASFADPRVRAGLVMAPVLGSLLEPESLRRIDRPLLLITADADDQAPAAGTARTVAALVRGADHEDIAGFGHYAFLAHCRAALRAELPALCADPGGQARELLHRRVLAQARRFFQLALGAGPQAVATRRERQSPSRL